MSNTVLRGDDWSIHRNGAGYPVFSWHDWRWDPVHLPAEPEQLRALARAATEAADALDKGER